ncbi:GNAT family N-acetyltransferase [Halobellus rubicundus]|uniref:GNAT family N-acetyltransferase n=1 Tax=Halobellus rubicundus TaxID=2996466 RepID=A0ABD5MGG5_9EURY
MSNDHIGAGAQATPEPLIIPLEECHTDAAKRLWSERFECDDEKADKWLYNARIDTDYVTQGFVAVDRTQVVGFGIAAVGSAEYANNYVGDALDLDVPDPTGILHILVVDADYEGQGIGTELVKCRLQWLATTDAETVIGTAWHRETHHDSRALFAKFGFERVATIEEYYLKTHGHTDCPDCEAECRCDASVWRRDQ